MSAEYSVGDIVIAGRSSFDRQINYIAPKRRIVRFRYPGTDIYWLVNEKPLKLNWGRFTTEHESGGNKFRFKDILGKDNL
jgi:hypothetical protein